MNPVGSEQGAAILTALLLLFLLTGVALLALQSAYTEKGLSGYSRKEAVALALAESGIEQTLAWFADPSQSPNPDFFQEQFCEHDPAKAPDFAYSSPLIKAQGALSELEREDTIALRIYKSSHQDGVCTVESQINEGKGIQVDFGRNPMPPIDSGISKGEEAPLPFPVHLEWDTTDRSPTKALGDQEWDNLKRFIKRFGRYVTITPEGRLEENGNRFDSFEKAFAKEKDEDRYDLVFIDTIPDAPVSSQLLVGQGFYKGYFYFSGAIHIVAGGGRSIAVPPPESSDENTDIQLDSINLDGLFYTTGKIFVDRPFAEDAFRVYGAIYARDGFAYSGSLPPPELPLLVVWYNRAFQSGSYHGVPPLIRLPGTWRLL